MKERYTQLCDRKRRTTLVLLAFFAVLFGACKDPAKGLTLTITPDVFDYTVAVKLYDAADPGHIPSDVKMTLSGPVASNVYEISGLKKYDVSKGSISLGLRKASNPLPGKPAVCYIDIRANGYLPLRIPVKFTYGQLNRQLVVYLIDLNNPPAGVSVGKSQVTLTDSATAAETVIATPLSGDKKESARLTIPAGTKFLNESGRVIQGNNATVTVVHFDARHPIALNAFPGGCRAADSISDTANIKAAGYFQPAGTAVVMATVGSTAARAFSKSLSMRMDVSGEQWNPATGTNYLPGDRIASYRRSADASSWTQQRPSALSMSNGKLSAGFSLNQATIYTMAYSAPVCAESEVRWQSRVAGKETYVMDVFAANDQFLPIASYVVQADNEETIFLPDMPSDGVSLKIYTNILAHPVTDFSKRTPAIGLYNGLICGGAIVTVNPGDREPFYFDVLGYCSNDNTYIRPTFYVEYALKGSDDFQLLGLVENGRFVTRNLDTATVYDFRLFWGGRRSSLITRKASGEFGGRVVVEVPPDEQDTYCP